jgi:hypothetical protein
MSIPTFIEGYPQDNQSLGASKPVIRGNLDGTFQTLGIDHQDQNEANPGYHNLIHEITQTVVNTLTGFNQIFSGIPGTLNVNSKITPTIPPNGDTQLYSLSSMGGLSQLTGSNYFNEYIGGEVQSGYFWAGGILVQFGHALSTAPSTPVSFPVTFPTTVFTVVGTRGQTASSDTSWGVSSLDNAGFNFNANSASTGAVLYWIALGN